MGICKADFVIVVVVVLKLSKSELELETEPKKLTNFRKWVSKYHLAHK